ncbi:hypothetical protein EXIGLDRAFT_678800 [Exidia glandulosa HHB12029]|uniref:Glutathione S-transferase n=1 Tax=Exidia glandulosa HHB12029 TaxID=1314781 RepID=A0A165F941_EXIGL|nr:hypothetical protein EXIGLDRAFT_678800 [Exidia glandulosa HHB12029]
MTETTYDVMYFQFPGMADISRLILETVGAKYTNTFITDESFKPIKHEQRFGKVPRLTVKKPDGTVSYVWESKAIHEYLAEVFNLLPDGASSDPLLRAECMSNIHSLYEQMDRLMMMRIMPTLELRKVVRDMSVADKLPKALEYHEKIVAQSGGTYYFGNKLTLPDLILYALNVRFKRYFGEGVLINETVTPSLYKLVQSLEAGKPGEYVRERSDWGKRKWDTEQLTYVAV